MTYEILDAILSDGFSLAIVDVVAKGTGLLGLAVCATVMLRHSSAAVRHRLWALTLGGLVVLPLLSWLVPGWRVAVLPERTSRTVDVKQGGRRNGLVPNARATAADDSSLQDESSELQSGPAKADASLAELPPPVAASGADEKAEATDASQIARALFVLWAVGGAIAALPLLIGIAGNECRRRRSRPVTDPAWLGLLRVVQHQLQCNATPTTSPQRAAGLTPAVLQNTPCPTLNEPEIGIARRAHHASYQGADTPCSPVRLFLRVNLARLPELRQTGESLIPLTWGTLRPIILLPADADRWAEPVRRHVLLHELAHIRRFDVTYQIVGRLAAAMYWFHPLAWYALHRLRAESEHACDDCVVSAGEPACEYAQHLLDLAMCLRSPRLVAAVGMARTSALEQRMRWLFDEASSHVPLGRRSARLLLLVAIFLIGGLAAVEPGRSEGEEVVAGDDRAENLPDGTKPSAKRIGELDQQSPDPKRTEKFFEKRYALVAGQVFKRVGPPYVKGRLGQYRATASAEQQAAMPDGPGHNYFYWESGKPRLWKSDFNDEGVPLNALLHELAGIPAVEMDGDANLWVMTKIEGDFVLRKGAALDEIVSAVEEMLNDDLEIPSRLEFREVEREVYVVRGKFVAKPAGPPWRPGDASYLIYGKQGPGAHPNGASNAGSFVDLLKTVGDRVGSPIVVDVAEPPQGYFGWQVYFDDPDRTIWSEFPRHFAKNPALVLQHVGEQTGLTFTKEKRVVKILYLERRKEGEAPRARRAADRRASTATSNDDAAALPKIYTHPISVTGRALDASGKPIGGARIYLASRRGDWKRIAETQTDADGRYEFRGAQLPIESADTVSGRDAGAFEVFGQAAGYGFAWRPQKWFFPVPRAETEADRMREPYPDPPDRFDSMDEIAVDLTFPPVARLRGEIVDDSGNPVPGVSLAIRYCEPLSVERFKSGSEFSALNERNSVPPEMNIRITDANGRFEFDGLPPECRFRIDVRPKNNASRWIWAATSDQPQAVYDESPVATGEIKLTFAAPREIRVKVAYGDTGAPAPNVLTSGNSRVASGGGPTGADGRVVLRLPPGAYNLEMLPVRGTPYLVTQQEFVVGDDAPTAILGRLRPAAIVEVKVVDAETGAGLADVDLWRQREPGTPENPNQQPFRMLHHFRSYELETRICWVERPRTDAAGKLRALFDPGRHRIGIGMEAYPKGYAVVEADGQEIDCQPDKPMQVTFTMRKMAAAAPRK